MILFDQKHCKSSNYVNYYNLFEDYLINEKFNNSIYLKYKYFTDTFGSI